MNNLKNPADMNTCELLNYIGDEIDRREEKVINKSDFIMIGNDLYYLPDICKNCKKRTKQKGKQVCNTCYMGY